MTDLCKWHQGDHPVEPDIYCLSCGRVLATRDCAGCGKTYLDWEAPFDDVEPPPLLSPDGDLCCRRCAFKASAV